MQYISLLLLVSTAAALYIENDGNQEETEPFLLKRTTTKEVYYTANMANYETAEEACQDLFDGTLANIENAHDVQAIEELLKGQLVSRLWVGGSPTSSTGGDCVTTQTLNKGCWEWGNGVSINSALWHPNSLSKTQSTMSRTMYLRGKRLLDIDANTRALQYVCETAPNLPQTVEPENVSTDPTTTVSYTTSFAETSTCICS